MKTWEKTVITDLSFNKETKRLSFIIKHHTYTPKIVRYVQENYVRTPIYSGYSERIRIVKKFDKVINPIKFVEKEILDLNLDKKFILWIIEGINITPQWRKKELELERISNLIIDTKRKMRDYQSKKSHIRLKKLILMKNRATFDFASFFLFSLSVFHLSVSIVEKMLQKTRELIKKIRVKKEFISFEIEQKINIM